jgi:hypothetical protein
MAELINGWAYLVATAAGVRPVAGRARLDLNITSIEMLGITRKENPPHGVRGSENRDGERAPQSR